MGADTRDESREIAEIGTLSIKARNYLSHHIRNGLQKVVSGTEAGRPDMVKNAVAHILHDLERVGC